MSNKIRTWLPNQGIFLTHKASWPWLWKLNGWKSLRVLIHLHHGKTVNHACLQAGQQPPAIAAKWKSTALTGQQKAHTHFSSEFEVTSFQTDSTSEMHRKWSITPSLKGAPPHRGHTEEAAERPGKKQGMGTSLPLFGFFKPASLSFLWSFLPLGN